MVNNPIKDTYQMNDYTITNLFLYGFTPRPRKPCKGLKKSFTKRTAKLFSKVFACKKFVYNVAGRPEWEKDIKEYSDLVLKYVGRDDSIVTYKEAEPFTTKVKKIDCSKAIGDLGHDPKIQPEGGIRRTVEWMKSIYHWEG